MRRAAEIGAAYGYYFAYGDYGVKPGEHFDVQAVYAMAREKVRQTIQGIEGIGFIPTAEGKVRVDVLKELVEIADSGKYDLARETILRVTSRGSKKGALRREIERLIENDKDITREQIIALTAHVRNKHGKRRTPVKHKRAVYDALRDIASKPLE